MSTTTPHAAEYFSLFQSAVISPARIAEVDAIINQILKHKDRYCAVMAEAKTPWFVIALLHNLECGLSFDGHLHNGDAISHATVNEPRNRPPGWMDLPAVMRTWERSAPDALHFDGLDFAIGWDVAQICFECEKFNGFGYRNRNVPDPYLWAGSQHYVAGKFIRDHVFDERAVSEEIGAAVILKRMDARGMIDLVPVA